MSAERVFLVTGATGAIGSAVVPLLLAEPRIHVYMLIRAASAEALATRVDSLMDFWQERVDRRLLNQRLFAVAGDVRKPLLGMSEAVYDALSTSVTNVVHSAGDVKLNQSIDEARASAVLPAQHVIAFARACGTSRPIPKIEHLSTVGVAGRRAGLVPEGPLEASAGYHNAYEQAKAETETLLLHEMKAGVPITLHRPSMVVGDSRDGRIPKFQVFYHLARFIAGSRTFGVLPDFRDIRLDLISVDYVAHAVVASARRDDSVSRIFNLCAGPADAMSLRDLGERLRQFLAAQGEPVFRPRQLPGSTFQWAIHVGARLASARTRKALESLPYFFAYLEQAQLFENAQTIEFLEQDGISPIPARQFLAPVLEYWYRKTSAMAR